MNSENERKYLSKAKDSFRTKKQFFIFDKALRNDHTCYLNDFIYFEISQTLVDIYTTQYWQYDRKDKINLNQTPDDIYQFMINFEKQHSVIISEMEANYLDNYQNVFKKEDFENLLNNKHCFYCNITEAQILELANSHKLYKKNERGWKLEIDRINSNKEYRKDNCVMACYWCNNAKTDEFTAEEFAEVGKAIGKIWEMRLNEIAKATKYQKDSTLVLEFGGEGGSIKLIKIEKDYYFTTDESALMDLLPGEFEADELVSTYGPFNQFEAAFAALMKRYSVFKLYPLSVSPNYASEISIYLKEYISTEKYPDNNFNINEWKELLKVK